MNVAGSHSSKQTDTFWPTNAAASLCRPLTSPVVTSEFVEVLFASMDVLPADTEPMTCPATPSPVVAVDDWLIVARLLPSWMLFASELVTSALTRIAPKHSSKH